MGKAKKQDKCIWKKAPIEENVMCLMKGNINLCALWKHNDHWVMRLHCFNDTFRTLEGEYDSLEGAERAAACYIYSKCANRAEHYLDIMEGLLEANTNPSF